MKVIKVVIDVEGGVVQGVYANEHIDLDIVDADDLEEQGVDRKGRERILKRAIRGLQEVTEA